MPAKLPSISFGFCKPHSAGALDGYPPQQFYECFKTKHWKGLRLWAADGTGFRLPDEEWLGEEFGTATSTTGCLSPTNLIQQNPA